jgi:hypothetical protein
MVKKRVLICISFEDYNFIKKEKINLSKLVREFIEKIKKIEPERS